MSHLLHSLSLVVASGACFLGAVRELLIVVTCCGARCRSQALEDVGSVVVAHGLSCSEACGIFPDQGLNPCALHWQVDF